MKKALLICIILLGTTVMAQAPQAQIDEARKLYQTGEYRSLKKALIMLEELLQQHPKDGKVLANLAIIYAHLSYRDWHFGIKDTDYANAAQQFANKAVSLGNGGDDAIRAQATVLLILGKRSEARAQAEKIIKSNDAEAFYIHACASEGSITDEATAAGKSMKKAVEGGNLYAMQDVIMSYVKKSDVSNAQRVLGLLKQKFPNHSETEFYEGMTLLAANNIDGARGVFEKFVQKNPTSNLTEYVKVYLNR